MAIAEGFERKWNFPGCCGAIDGKHVVIRAPAKSGSEFYNYKKTNSIILMAVVDHNYLFSYVNIGSNGRNSDGGIFRNTNLYRQLENGLLPPGNYLVGDAAFPLKTYLMKPYPGTQLTTKQKVFNYRLSRARGLVESTFGILVSRFRVFEKPISLPPQKTDLIVKACCAIHNWLRQTNPSPDAPITGDFSSKGLQSKISNNMINNPSKASQRIRDQLADWFVGSGSIPWQLNQIH